MLKVLLVDDELIIREGMATGIDWESIGFKVAGQAEDGEIALAIIEKVKPDLVITDIKMPFVDGLQLVEFLKEKYPQVFTIIISGHDEFQYAQRAVKLGAYDYLLKPLDLEYLNQLLKKIKVEIELERELHNDSVEFNNIKIFNKIWASTKLSERNIQHLENYWGKTIQQAVFSAAVLSFDLTYSIAEDLKDSNTTLLDYLIQESISNVYPDMKKKMILLDSGKYGMVLSGTSFEELKVMSKTFYGVIRRICNEEMGHSVFIAVSGMHKGFVGLGLAVGEAEKACNLRYISGSHDILFYNDIKKNDTDEKAYYDISSMVTAIKLGEKTQLEQELDKLLKASVKRRGMAHEFISFVSAALFSEAVKIVQEYGGRIESVYPDPLTGFKNVSSMKTIDSAICKLREYLIELLIYLSDLKKDGFDNQIIKARDYISVEYNNKRLSLQDVADHVHMNLCYLSVLFKKQTGQSYIEYLTRIRMDKASDLLANSKYRSYEVADMVGYENATYFSTAFKKLLGLSPLEYRKKYSTSNWEDF
jgi:two-component system response regulator YesN